MALVPTDPATEGASYWLLDDETPALPELLRQVGSHYRVRVPTARIPVGLVKRLPASLTKADPETLSFLSTDRYPVRPAEEFAALHGLPMPETMPALLAWVDHLAAHRFGEAEGVGSAAGPRRRFTEYAGVRTFELGPSGAADTVVLPGLPVNADTWQEVAQSTNAHVVDLPGLGMSSGDAGDWTPWLDALLHETGVRHVVGHSIGAAAAVEAAARRPGHVAALTLVAPFFLQDPARRVTGARLLAAAYLRRVRSDALSRRLTGTTTHAGALGTTTADLRRPGTARRVARLLRSTADREWRAQLVELLAAFPGRVHVIVGSDDPLAAWAPAALEPLGSRATVTTIEAAGHHPHLTHPDRVAAAIAAP
jgi:pimeloyl-ACP methyl ester carboxylesterase